MQLQWSFVHKRLRGIVSGNDMLLRRIELLLDETRHDVL